MQALCKKKKVKYSCYKTSFVVFKTQFRRDGHSVKFVFHLSGISSGVNLIQLF